MLVAFAHQHNALLEDRVVNKNHWGLERSVLPVLAAMSNNLTVPIPLTVTRAALQLAVFNIFASRVSRGLQDPRNQRVAQHQNIIVRFQATKGHQLLELHIRSHGLHGSEEQRCDPTNAVVIFIT